MLNRDKFITLVFAGGSADLAYLHNSTFTIKEYEDCLKTDEYTSFATQLNNEFIANADQRLLGNLYRVESALQTVGADSKTYPQILKSYVDILKLTSPIVERLSKHAMETNTFNGLRLVINPPSNEGEGVGSIEVENETNA